MQESKTTKARKVTAKERAGAASVVLWEDNFKEFHQRESLASSWGDGFFDFARSVHAINSGQGFIHGKFDDGFYVLSDRNPENFG